MNSSSFELDPLRFDTEMKQSITVPHSFGTAVHSPSNSPGWGTTRREAVTKNLRVPKGGFKGLQRWLSIKSVLIWCG